MNGDEVRELRKDVVENRERLVRVETEVESAHEDIRSIHKCVKDTNKMIVDNLINNATRKGASKVFNWMLGSLFIALICALISKVVGLW